MTEHIPHAAMPTPTAVPWTPDMMAQPQPAQIQTPQAVHAQTPQPQNHIPPIPQVQTYQAAPHVVPSQAHVQEPRYQQPHPPAPIAPQPYAHVPPQSQQPFPQAQTPQHHMPLHAAPPPVGAHAQPAMQQFQTSQAQGQRPQPNPHQRSLMQIPHHAPAHIQAPEQPLLMETRKEPKSLFAKLFNRAPKTADGNLDTAAGSQVEIPAVSESLFNKNFALGGLTGLVIGAFVVPMILNMFTSQPQVVTQAAVSAPAIEIAPAATITDESFVDSVIATDTP